MKTTDEFTFKTKLMDMPGCRFAPGRYGNGNLALQIYDGEGPVCTCSVNPGRTIGPGRLCVKDYSENEGMADFLKKLGIIGERVASHPSGWVHLDEYELTESGKELFEGV